MHAIRTVLCPIDFTPLSDTGLRLASRICSLTGARLIIEHNMDPAPPLQMGVSWMYSEEHESSSEKGEDAEKRLKEILGRIPGSIPREARLTRGPLDLGLFYVARDVDADLIVMGTHGRSTTQHHSMTEELLAKAPCCVLTVSEESRSGAFLEPAPQDPPAQLSALVPVSFSRRGQTLLDQAFAMARTLELRLHLLHVERAAGAQNEEGTGSPDPQHRGEIEQRLQALVPEDLADRTSYLVTAGSPREQILNSCESAAPDLLIMPRDKGGLFRALFPGASAPEILHLAPCPVWFVPTKGPGLPG